MFTEIVNVNVIEESKCKRKRDCEEEGGENVNEKGSA